ncbi:MAG: hypothetical protein IPG58_17820 [Acidobacteria bacterium]|nr:hypothetical protein [Acidobacteriota bacterium]
MTLYEWLTEICSTEKPDDSIVAYNFGLFETDEGFTVYLVGSNEYNEADPDWACTETFVPKQKYFPLSSSEYENLDWQQVLETFTAQLTRFTQTDSFINSFFVDAVAITTGFDDGDLVNIC